MKATRDGFGEQLVESGKENPNIIGLSADLGKATKIDKFGEAYPDRLFEMGIAENNMIGVASGMAEYDYKVFLASFASFLTLADSFATFLELLSVRIILSYTILALLVMKWIFCIFICVCFLLLCFIGIMVWAIGEQLSNLIKKIEKLQK